MALPAEYQRIEEGQKQTATAMKACIKEYNATLPSPVKTSGSRDVLLEQLAIINPDLVAQEAQKPTPLKVSGTKADMIRAVKSVKPDAIFADELLDAWRDNPGEKDFGYSPAVGHRASNSVRTTGAPDRGHAADTSKPRR